MPKGFLVKRSKKTALVSYRIRGEEDTTPVQTDAPPSGVSGAAFFAPVLTSNYTSLLQKMQGRICFGGVPESFYGPSLSPTRPDNEDYTSQYPSADSAELSRNIVSPTQAEILPEPLLGSFGVSGASATPALPEMTTKIDSICGDRTKALEKRPAPTSSSKPNQTNSKKRKTSSSPPQEKRSIMRDEVTTSPVLGLRIKEDPDEDLKQRSSAGSPLGEFICQLCKERYSDPLTLAHHKCSRIVRIEYRCTECDKTFSCPANLASHRRWHKPKGTQGDTASPQQDDRLQPQAHFPSPSSVARSETGTLSPQSDSCSDEEMSFSCPQCSKKFRRQAYLRKHLALHNKKAANAASQSPNETTKKVGKITSNPCQSSSVSERETLDNFSKYPTTEQTTKVSGDVFPCRFCGDNFFSSPGLTRHINKYHPTENRQVIFLSQAV
ncbi:insulinoma-associated protein 1b-like [Chanos chanos]|uniref:Insulinoma-associated protein 1b-like n=1 Tax=Chanos chanos TaxID=29144 RepID=A0A6J2WWV1_CHACN|nr:insulinoma-associated protein 1b-like [Chanos chanos]